MTDRVGHGTTWVPLRDIVFPRVGKSVDLTQFVSSTKRPAIKATIIPPHVNLRCPKCETETRLELGEGEKEGVFPMTFYGTCPGCNHNLRVIATQEPRPMREMVERAAKRIIGEMPDPDWDLAKTYAMCALEWQPIETAPIETEVLVTDGQSVCTAELDIDFGRDWWLSVNNEVVANGLGEAMELPFTPTHWMPKPQPPLEERQA